MMAAMEDHRSPKLPELTAQLRSGLAQLLKSESAEIVMFPSSGTGAWEAALTNTLSPGDVILASRFGQFSHLWIEMAQKLGFDVRVRECEWGESSPVDRIEQALRKDTQHRIKAVLACHNETATGVTSDIAAIREVRDAAGHPALLYVDGVSSIACIDFRMDDWGVDLVVSGSQKGLMLPPGLSILAASRGQWRQHRRLEALAVRKEPGTVFRYGERGGRSERHRRCAGDRRRVQALQPWIGRGTVEGRRSGVPDRPSR